LHTADLHRSWTMSPSLAYQMFAVSLVCFTRLPRPTASHAMPHSARRFVASMTRPVFGSMAFKILINTRGRATIRVSSSSFDPPPTECRAPRGQPLLGYS
jgi:hypothetical protein